MTGKRTRQRSTHTEAGVCCVTTEDPCGHAFGPGGLQGPPWSARVLTLQTVCHISKSKSFYLKPLGPELSVHH